MSGGKTKCTSCRFCLFLIKIIKLYKLTAELYAENRLCNNVFYPCSPARSLLSLSLARSYQLSLFASPIKTLRPTYKTCGLRREQEALWQSVKQTADCSSSIRCVGCRVENLDTNTCLAAMLFGRIWPPNHFYIRSKWLYICTRAVHYK